MEEVLERHAEALKQKHAVRSQTRIIIICRRCSRVTARKLPFMLACPECFGKVCVYGVS